MLRFASIPAWLQGSRGPGRPAITASWLGPSITRRISSPAPTGPPSISNRSDASLRMMPEPDQPAATPHPDGAAPARQGANRDLPAPCPPIRVAATNRSAFRQGARVPLAMSSRSLKDAAARIATIPQIMDKAALHRHALNRLLIPSTIPAVREHPRSRLRKLRNT
jgi:hypothetical protein